MASTRLPAMDPGQQLFVLLSQARSGTSWLTAMLNSHRDVLVEDEEIEDGNAVAASRDERLAQLEHFYSSAIMAWHTASREV